MPDPTLSGNTADEQDLVRSAREGSHDAFRSLVERHMKRAYNVAFSFVNNHQGAEEVTQDAFVRAYEAIGSFRGDAEFSTWLHRIVMNLSLNKIRQSRSERARRAEGSPDDLSTTDGSPVPGDDVARHIERALHELPTMQRATVILRHMDGLSTRQVSGILRCSEGTVKTHLYRGLAKLRKKLEYLRDGGI